LWERDVYSMRANSDLWYRNLLNIYLVYELSETCGEIYNTYD
jgi:hypothetical protein